MKKIYITPSNRIINLDCESEILTASSMDISGEVNDAVGTQKKQEGSIWSDERGIWK